MHAPILWVVGLSVIPLNQYLMPLRFAQKRQLGEACLWMSGHPLKQGPQVLEHPIDRALLEAPPIKPDVEQQLLPPKRRYSQRVVRRSDESKLPLRPALVALLLLQGTLQGLMLEHHHALEERAARRHLAPGMDVDQWSV